MFRSLTLPAFLFASIVLTGCSGSPLMPSALETSVLAAPAAAVVPVLAPVVVVPAPVVTPEPVAPTPTPEPAPAPEPAPPTPPRDEPPVGVPVPVVPIVDEPGLITTPVITTCPNGATLGADGIIRCNVPPAELLCPPGTHPSAFADVPFCEKN